MYRMNSLCTANYFDHEKILTSAFNLQSTDVQRLQILLLSRDQLVLEKVSFGLAMLV